MKNNFCNATQVLALGIFLFAPTANTRPYNYMDVPVGERSFGMGQTSMAIMGDVGNILYNPATLADTSSAQVSAALSAYARIDTRTGEYVSLFRSAAENISRGGFLAIPSMFGGQVRWGTWVWGGAVLVPDSFQNSGTVDLDTNSTAVFNSTFQSVWLGFFLAKRWSDHTAGLSVFYASRNYNEKFFYTYISDNPTLRFIQTGHGINGLVAILGGTYSINSDWTVGYSLRPPPLPFSGKLAIGDVSSGLLEGIEKPTEVDSKFFPIPVRLSLGLSYQPTGRWLFGFDAHYFGELSGNLDNESKRESFNHQAKAIVNFCIGAEYFPFASLGIRTGIYSNLSAAKEVPEIVSAINDKVHMFGGTAAIVFDKSQGSISIGGYVQGGQGQSISLDFSGAVVPRSNYTYGAVIGSSYKF